MTLNATDPHLEAALELQNLHAGRQSLGPTLDRIVASVANRMETDVGSLYLLESEGTSLVLMSTVGLLQSCVGNLRMQLHEGLVGLVAQQRAPVVLPRATEHPRFKYFPQADEDKYQSFLGVPILHGRKLQGVLVVQTIEPRDYAAAETSLLAGIADRLGPSLESCAG
ncbi:MAG: GAF domain-containing protein [Bythopirellula sp.]